MIAALTAIVAKPTWKLALVLALLASGALNLWQWERSRTAPLRMENRALGAALTTINAVAQDAHRDNAALMTELDALIERGRETRVVYRRAVVLTPLPDVCAPGAARVQAVNQGLGPSESPLRKSP